MTITTSTARPLTLFILVLASVLTTACSTRTQVTIDSPPNVAANATGIPVKIVEVRDSRQFTVNPSNPSLESLGNASDITNPAITARAVGRLRNHFGHALGDYTLPEGKTVSGLVAEAARSALHEKGYRVVDGKSPDHGNALPLALDVKHFWAWVRPGFPSLEMRFNADVAVTGAELVGAPGPLVHVESTMHIIQMFDSDWEKLIQNGVTALVTQLKARLRNPQEIKRP
jgi:hypothetical protein